ncbi:MAG: ABC transporter permease [Acidimicrobiaceae bacterium]|nr:ABC transporter permease [Acidimicrobiaceae bacterium]
MRSHNLRTVISFEVHRTITKRRFWIATLIVPLAIAIVFGLVVASSNATQSSLAAQKSVNFSFAYHDASGVINKALMHRLGGVELTSVSTGIGEVRAGRIDAFFEYPANPIKEQIRVFGKDVGIFNNSKYANVATELLQASADQKIASAKLATLARGGVKVDTTTYINGVTAPGIKGLVPPLIYLVVFYLVIVLLGNQMLNSTLEEKENRVTEMILTTVDPNTLIIGKILSLFTAGLLQMAIFASPVIIGYVFFRSSLNLPNLNLSNLVFNARSMSVGALVLLGGFVLFTGTLVAIGAVMPTAKEAAGFFGVMMAMIFIPFYISSLIVSHPSAFIVQVFTFFPYTAPVTGMIRNGFGSLSPIESAILIVEQFSFGYVVLRIAVQLFRSGSIEYTKKVSIRGALGMRNTKNQRS